MPTFDALVGQTLNVSLQPYYGGTAHVIAVRPTHEYGRPDRLIDGMFTMTVVAINMTETSRLFSATSSKPVKPGTTFELHLYNSRLDHIIATGRADYVYPV